MAPRVRPKKVGLKRIDAAIDALGQLGFSKDQVRSTINELLKVYGGDEGWTFIEEGAYRVVLERILEDQEEKLKQNDSRCGDVGHVAGALEICQLSMIDDARTSHNTSKNGISGDMLASSANAMVPAACAPAAMSNNVSWKDIACVDHSTNHSLLLDHQHASAAGEPGQEEYGRLEIIPRLSDHPITSQPRRQPCHGWISESESDDEKDKEQDGDLGTNHDAHRVRRRKSRWDVMPSNC